MSKKWNIDFETGTFTTEGGIGSVYIDFKTIYKESFARDSVAKYDRGFSLQSKDIKTILERNDFQTKLEELGYQLSYHGGTYGLVIFRFKGESYVDWVKVIGTPVFEFGRLIDVYFDTNQTIDIRNGDDTIKTSLFGRFFYNSKNKVIKQTGYYNAGGEFTNYNDEIEYDTNEIPLVVMYNNSFKVPDLSPAAEGMVQQLENFINKIPDEFEKGKIIFAFNNLINSQMNGKKFKDRVIKNGESSIDLTDPDGNVANSVTPFVAGTAAIDTSMRLYGFYDSRIKELSQQFRDHGNDSRKSEYDLAMFNQAAHEYMSLKISFRERQLQKFVDLISRIESIKTAKIKLKISEFETNRILNLNAITDLKVAQADQARGVATKNNQEGAFLQHKIDNPSPDSNSEINPDINPATVAKPADGLPNTTPAQSAMPKETQ